MSLDFIMAAIEGGKRKNAGRQVDPPPARSLLDRIKRLRALLRLDAQHYRPEKHYMRGPGPKCRERRQKDRS